MVLGERRRARDGDRDTTVRDRDRERDTTSLRDRDREREREREREKVLNQETKTALERVCTSVKSLEHALKLYTESLNAQTKLLCRNSARENDSDRVDVKDEELQREDTVTVMVRVVFMKIGDIDTLKEQYEADLFIHIAWQEPAFDGLSEKDIKDTLFENCWNPKLYIENAVEPKEESYYCLEFDDKGRATVIEKRRCKGVFLESLELKHFPFDTQDLSVTLTTERSEIELKLVEEPKKLSSINTQSFVDAQEWDLHSHVETERTWTTKEFSGSQYRCPAVVFTCRAARRPGFFLYNILLIMFFISTLAFNTFAVDGTLTQNRLQLSFTLVLTSVAFKFVVNQSLPKISYLTYLDKYILASMGILCIVCFWHALVSILIKHIEKRLVEDYDLYSLITIGVIYILFHIAFFLNIYLDAGKRRRDMYLKDVEYKEARDRLEVVHVRPTTKRSKKPTTDINGGTALGNMDGIQGLPGLHNKTQQYSHNHAKTQAETPHVDSTDHGDLNHSKLMAAEFLSSSGHGYNNSSFQMDYRPV